MASYKRERQRANKLARQEEVQLEKGSVGHLSHKEKRFEAGLNAALTATKNKNMVQYTAGALLSIGFYYGVVSKLGTVIKATMPAEMRANAKLPLPTFRGIIPEPFDIFSHLSNAYWTKVLMDVPLPFTDTSMRDGGKFAIDHLQYQVGEAEKPSLLQSALKAGAIGTALHVGVETITEYMPGTLGRLMGGFDPLDVAYGGAAAAIIAGYGMYRQRNAIDQAVADI